MKLFEVPITDMMVVCGKNENENTRLGRVVMVQFVTPSFHPNLIGNVLSMSKCLHSYTLLTWLHQNKYPFKVNALNTSYCTIWCFCSAMSRERQVSNIWSFQMLKTCHSLNLKLIKPRSRGLLRSRFFSRRVVHCWNQLPDEVVSAVSTNSFKAKLDKFLGK